MLYRHFQYKYPFTSNYNTSASKLPQKSFPLEYDRMVGSRIPVYVFVRSFVFTCSFGRENDVRSEQALRNGSVALECMHMYS